MVERDERALANEDGTPFVLLERSVLSAIPFIRVSRGVDAIDKSLLEMCISSRGQSLYENYTTEIIYLDGPTDLLRKRILARGRTAEGFFFLFCF